MRAGHVYRIVQTESSAAETGGGREEEVAKEQKEREAARSRSFLARSLALLVSSSALALFKQLLQSHHIHHSWAAAFRPSFSFPDGVMRGSYHSGPIPARPRAAALKGGLCRVHVCGGDVVDR